MKKNKAHSDRIHHSLMVTPRQAARIKTGNLESKPADYAVLGGTDGAVKLAALHRKEDMDHARELKSLENWFG